MGTESLVVSHSRIMFIAPPSVPAYRLPMSAHDAHAGPRTYFERNVAQDRVIVVVREGDLPEGHRAYSTSEGPGILPFGNIRRFIEEGEGPLGAGQRPLQMPREPTESLERTVQLREVGHHQEQIPESQDA